MGSYDTEMRLTVEFIPRKLYYVALSRDPSGTRDPRKHFVTIDNDMIYWNFYLDFGPLNLGHTYRFCMMINKKLNDPKYRDKEIYFYSHPHGQKRANAAMLICSWAVLYNNKSPQEAFEPFKNYPYPFPMWHDATPNPSCSFPLTILDTLKGLKKARDCNFFDFDDFDVDEYEYYEQVENGDLNWYAQGRFAAFAGPHAERIASPGGYHSLRPDDYVQYFKKSNVKLVVRLNKAYYDSRKFTKHGIDHMDLYYLDGSNPSDAILQKFLTKVESSDGAVAVHCKAGLGRTGTVIGCYLMKHFKFTAEEIIGWFRIVRPGSIIGPQQQYMKDNQFRMWREGDIFRSKGKVIAADKHFTPNLGSDVDRQGLLKGVSSMTIADSKELDEEDDQQMNLEKQTQGDLLRLNRQKNINSGVNSRSSRDNQTNNSSRKIGSLLSSFRK